MRREVVLEPREDASEHLVRPDDVAFHPDLGAKKHRTKDIGLRSTERRTKKHKLRSLELRSLELIRSDLSSRHILELEGQLDPAARRKPLNMWGEWPRPKN